MNWLGWSAAAFLGALLGGALGAGGYAAALAQGWDLPWIVGLLAGAGALVGSPDKSGLRALLVATAAVWIAATVQTTVGPFAEAGIAGFHETLTARRLLAFTACGAAAFALARTSLRKHARRRAAGS